MPAYNNYYPNYYPNYTYLPAQQPVYQPPTNMTSQQPTPTQTSNINPTTTGMIWVNSEQDAQNYLVAPNNAVALWDSNNPVVYVKQADASGRPYLKIYDLTERTGSSADASKPAVTYAEKDEVAAIKADFESFRNEIKTIKKDIVSLKRKREDEDE